MYNVNNIGSTYYYYCTRTYLSFVLNKMKFIRVYHTLLMDTGFYTSRII